jgi:hypothetical protein
MFCVADGTLYRRTTGDWAAVLTSADARTLAGYSDGETLRSVIVDPVTGYVYALLSVPQATSRVGVLRSTDHGDSWTATTVRSRAYTYNQANIDAYNGLVVLHVIPALTTAVVAYFSQNHGQTWGAIGIDSTSNFQPAARIHPAAGDTWYGNVSSTCELLRCRTDGTGVRLQDGARYGPRETAGGVWCDPADADHFLVATDVSPTYIMETRDGGSTAERDAAASQDRVYEIADGCEEGYWVQGSRALGVTGVYASTDAVTLTSRVGAGATAIPAASNGIAPRGLWVVPRTQQATPYVYACVIPNADGRAAAIPLYGDRASWRTDVDGGATHADDWVAGDSHHAPVTLGSGSDSALSLSGQELTLADVLTPTEHDTRDHTGVPGVGGGGWEPLTNGDAANPELVFADGDVVMVAMEE